MPALLLSLLKALEVWKKTKKHGSLNTNDVFFYFLFSIPCLTDRLEGSEANRCDPFQVLLAPLGLSLKNIQSTELRDASGTGYRQTCAFFHISVPWNNCARPPEVLAEGWMAMQSQVQVCHTHVHTTLLTRLQKWFDLTVYSTIFVSH